MTRAAVIESFLADLERTKECGIIAAAFPTLPAWTGPDSDEVREECGNCGTAEPHRRIKKCAHCDVWYCDHQNAGCYDAHVDRARRRG